MNVAEIITVYSGLVEIAALLNDDIFGIRI